MGGKNKKAGIIQQRTYFTGFKGFKSQLYLITTKYITHFRTKFTHTNLVFFPCLLL